MTDDTLKLNANNSLLLLVHRSSEVNLVVFPTFMLSQNFTPAVSARNLGVTFDNNNNILDSIYHKLVVAAFIIFVTFVVFASICLLLSPKLLQLLLLVVDLTFAIPFIMILLSRTS